MTTTALIASSTLDTSRDTSTTSIVPAMSFSPHPLPTSPSYELIPHRVFVGGFASATTESDLRLFFEKYGHVREAKVIRNPEGTSKGYGFVTFDTEEEASKVRSLSTETLELKGRRLNLGPAMRKVQQASKYCDYAIASPQLTYATTGAGGQTAAFQYSGAGGVAVVPADGYAVATPSPQYAQPTVYLVQTPYGAQYATLAPMSPMTPSQQYPATYVTTTAAGLPSQMHALAITPNEKMGDSPTKNNSASYSPFKPMAGGKTTSGITPVNGMMSQSPVKPTVGGAQQTTPMGGTSTPIKGGRGIAPTAATTLMPTQTATYYNQQQPTVAYQPMTPVTPGICQQQHPVYRWIQPQQSHYPAQQSSSYYYYASTPPTAAGPMVANAQPIDSVYGQDKTD